MLCEIEFLAVGGGSRPGDAIIVRYGTSIITSDGIDGGTTESGKELIAHLKNYFGENVSLAHVVLTHSDADHASGLREVLREIPVANLWLHIPWLLSSEARHLFKNKNWTEEGLREAIRKEYDVIDEIVELGIAANCAFHYPLKGESVGPFRVLAPSKYATCICCLNSIRRRSPTRTCSKRRACGSGSRRQEFFRCLSKR